MLVIMVLKYHCSVANGTHITVTVFAVCTLLCGGGIHITATLVFNSSVMVGRVFRDSAVVVVTFMYLWWWSWNIPLSSWRCMWNLHNSVMVVVMVFTYLLEVVTLLWHNSATLVIVMTSLCNVADDGIHITLGCCCNVDIRCGNLITAKWAVLFIYLRDSGSGAHIALP